MSGRAVVPAVRVLAAVLLAVWVVKVVALTRSVRAHAQHWSQVRGEPCGLTYVALGDSAAQGIGASAPERGYVFLLAQRLRAATGRPVQVVNLSAAGARIEDVLCDQLPRMRELTPDLVTVAVGGNDVAAYDRATFARQVERLTAAMPPGAYVADAPYFMHGWWERDAQQAADLLETHAARQGQVPVALHEALRSRGWSAMATDFAADWYHPNDRGHRVWADASWRQMEPRLPPHVRVAHRAGRTGYHDPMEASSCRQS